MGLELRAITDDEVLAFATAVDLGFGGDLHPDDEALFRASIPLDRTVAAFDGNELVGTLGDLALTLGVPGGRTLAMAGTSAVTVRATHRRRGILRAMVERHLDLAVGRGEPVAGLWASESAIYGRFGFGLAVEGHEITMDSRMTSTPAMPADVTVTAVGADLVRAEVAPFWSEMLGRQPGWIERDEVRWAAVLDDPERRRDGASKLRHAVARRGSQVVGYVAYRQRRKWENDVPEGTIAVSSIVAADIDARRALWHHVSHVDLFPRVHLWNAPLDEPIVYEVGNLRHMRRRRIDTLYLRILDVPTCLQRRRYEVDDALTLAVRDPLGHAEGTWSVEVRDRAATVARIDGPGQVSLDVRDLGALYLGRQAAGVLARSAHINGDPDAIVRLGRLLQTVHAPHCPLMF